MIGVKFNRPRRTKDGTKVTDVVLIDSLSPLKNRIIGHVWKSGRVWRCSGEGEPFALTRKGAADILLRRA